MKIVYLSLVAWSVFFVGTLSVPAAAATEANVESRNLKKRKEKQGRGKGQGGGTPKTLAAKNTQGMGKRETKSTKRKKQKAPDTPRDECPVPETPIDTELVRALLADYVSSLQHNTGPSQTERGYFRDANLQRTQWNMCTVVQQCLDPDFMLSLGSMSTASRGLVYRVLSKSMSQESFNMLQLQQHSNMLLGEMQDWATTCHGTCHELDDPNGQLASELGANPSTLIDDTDYDECATLWNSGNYTFWRCRDEPRMLHQADINTVTGEYELGNIFNEPHIHGRNSQYDYFSVYGDLQESGGAFGLRFSGHHLDLNYMWNNLGELMEDTPVFLGHNPLIVPLQTPPLTRASDDRAEIDQFDHFLMWQNMAGVAQFAEGVDLVSKCANALLGVKSSYIPLELWEYMGSFGALELVDNKTIADYDPMDLSAVEREVFEHVWGLVDYTLKFSRGKRSTSKERDLFRTQGKAVWTTSAPPEDGLPLSEKDMRANLNFFYVRAETDDWIFFCMVNQLYTVVSEKEPTNHLHSILIEKDRLNCDHACCPGDPNPC
jgi:hypothetical protein